MDKRVAVVTGANRGIGLEICRQLAQRDDVEVILTARHAGRGEAAAADLRAQGRAVSFHRLDVTAQNSVRGLAKAVADQFGRLDILINNAAIYPDKGLRVAELDLALVRQAFETNFYGPLRLCQMLTPLMARRQYGRVVNVSSSMGLLRNMRGRALAYRASKAALNALTRVLAAEVEGQGILVNSVDPGWVRTEMGGKNAPRTLAQGADTAVWLATLPVDGPSGGLFRDRQPVAW
ncbi:MAG TPA: SDR family oxidoreductase [Candidatus Sulfomarinibacteraceae bacterium]|nr:SDR family oxidoreductase [Candidatus Sulfomarinibacteraceae bacterium]